MTALPILTRQIQCMSRECHLSFSFCGLFCQYIAWWYCNCHNCLYHEICLCHKVYVLWRISCMWHWNWYAMVKMDTCGYTATYVSLFPIWEGCDYCWEASLQYCTEMHERGMSFKCVVSLHGIIHNMFNTAKSIVEYHAEQPSSFTYKWFRIFLVCFWRIWKWESDCSQCRHL